MCLRQEIIRAHNSLLVLFSREIEEEKVVVSLAFALLLYRGKSLPHEFQLLPYSNNWNIVQLANLL